MFVGECAPAQTKITLLFHPRNACKNHKIYVIFNYMQIHVNFYHITACLSPRFLFRSAANSFLQEEGETNYQMYHELYYNSLLKDGKM